MGCSQTITYGTMTLPFTKLQTDSRPTYDAAGTLVSTDYVIKVSGVLFADYYGQEELTLYNAMQRVQRNLETPRLPLTITWTPPAGPSSTVFRFVPGDGTAEGNDTDVDWGPLPDGVLLKDFTGGMACEYTWTVKCRTRTHWEGDGEGARKRATWSTNPIVSLTRTQTFEIGQNGMTTRTIAGSFTMVRARLGTQPPDALRLAVTPPLPDGFVRGPQRFEVQPDQLTCNFSFTDFEVCETLPPPIIGGSAEITVTTPRRGGMRNVRLSGKFIAAKDVSKETIIGIIYTMMRAKMGGNERRVKILSATVTADLYGENAIGFDFEWCIGKVALMGTYGGPRALIDTLVSRPGGTTGRSQIPSPYGTAGLTSYVLPKGYDPNAIKLSELAGKLAKRQDGDAGTIVPQNVNPPDSSPAFLPIAADDTSDVFDRTPIIDMSHVRSYEIDNHIVVLPTTDGPPIIQQVAKPTLQAIDAGFIRYLSQSPLDVPPLPEPPVGYVVRRGGPKKSCGTPVGDGSWSEYKLEFYYLSVYPKSVEAGTNAFKGLNLTTPRDIRRASEVRSAEAPFGPGPDRIVG